MTYTYIRSWLQFWGQEDKRHRYHISAVILRTRRWQTQISDLSCNSKDKKMTEKISDLGCNSASVDNGCNAMQRYPDARPCTADRWWDQSYQIFPAGIWTDGNWDCKCRGTHGVLITAGIRTMAPSHATSIFTFVLITASIRTDGTEPCCRYIYIWHLLLSVVVVRVDQNGDKWQIFLLWSIH